MRNRLAPLPILVLLAALWPSASGQSVRSTRSGLLYFFDGNVFIEEQQLLQKFGRFPEIGEGRILRTERGRAEVLLTPGVFLRVDENSAIRLLSDSLSDTRVELLHGSAILEVSREAKDPSDALIYKSWSVRAQQESVARMDSNPAQLRILSGTAAVTTDGSSGTVTVKRNEILPLSVVLVPEEATRPAADDFNTWAMNRSSVVSEDNTIAAGIIDDPNKIDNSGVAVGGFTYFPPTGIPLLGIDYPYGLSFWSPYQTAYNPFLSISPYGLGYPLYPIYPRSPFGTSIYPRPTFPRPVGTSPTSIGIGRPVTPVMHPRPSLPVPARTPTMAVPHAPTPHVIRR